MAKKTILQQFGWRQSGGKWTAEGHSRPLTTAQAKNALARDLRVKDFSAAKKSGKLERAVEAIKSGYRFLTGAFKRPGQRKARTLAQAESEINKKQVQKQVQKHKKQIQDRQRRQPPQKISRESDFRKLGFRSDAERKKISKWTKNNLELYERFVNQYQLTQGQITSERGALIAQLLYTYKHTTGAESRRALNDLLILTGYRKGNEPYPAGQTPKKKGKK